MSPRLCRDVTLTNIPLMGIFVPHLAAELWRTLVPIYEYRCSVCGEKFEKLVRTSSGAVEIRCPKCSADQVERQLSVFGVAGGSSVSSFASAPSCAPSGGG